MHRRSVRGGGLDVRRQVFVLVPNVSPIVSVRSRAGAVVCRLSLGRVHRFRIGARLGFAITSVSSPRLSNGACEFPALRFPASFTSKVM